MTTAPPQESITTGIKPWQFRLIHCDLRELVKVQQSNDMTVVSTVHALVNIASKNGLNTRVVMAFLKQIVAGPDGILGTHDDLLPASTIGAIKAVLTLDANMVEELVDFMFDVAEKTCESWLKCCMGCNS